MQVAASAIAIRCIMLNAIMTHKILSSSKYSSCARSVRTPFMLVSVNFRRWIHSMCVLHVYDYGIALHANDIESNYGSYSIFEFVDLLHVNKCMHKFITISFRPSTHKIHKSHSTIPIVKSFEIKTKPHAITTTIATSVRHGYRCENNLK